MIIIATQFGDTSRCKGYGKKFWRKTWYCCVLQPSTCSKTVYFHLSCASIDWESPCPNLSCTFRPQPRRSACTLFTFSTLSVMFAHAHTILQIRHDIHRLFTCPTSSFLIHVVGCDYDPSVMSRRGLMVNSALEVNRTGSHLVASLDEQECHMDNNPLYNIRIKAIAGHSTIKTTTWIWDCWHW